MLAVIVVPASIVVLWMSFRLFERATGQPITRLNMLTYGLYLLVVTAFVPSVIIAAEIPFLNHEELEIFRDRSTAWIVWGAVMWMLIAIPLGAIAANGRAGWGGRSGQATPDYGEAKRLLPGWGYQESTLLISVGVLTAALVGLFAATMPAESPLTIMMSGASRMESLVVRKTFSYGFEHPLLRSLFNEKLLMMLSLVSYGMVLRTGKYSWRALLVIQIAALMGLSVIRGTSAAFLQYCIALGFMRRMLGGTLIRVREGVVVALGVVFFFVFFKGAETEFLGVTAGVTTRVVFGQILGTFYAVQVIPQVHDFIGFASSGRLINDYFFGGSSPDYGIVLMELYNPVGVALGSAGHLSSIFLAESWANFGWAGLVGAPLWVGFVVQKFSQQFGRAERSVINAAMYVTLALSLGYASDIVSFYYPIGLLLTFAGAMLTLGLPMLLSPSRTRRRAPMRALVRPEAIPPRPEALT